MFKNIIIGFTLLLAACQSPSAFTTSPTSTPTPQITPTPSPTAIPIPKDDYFVTIHPEDGVYVGELVSFEVISQPNLDVEGQTIRIQANTDPAFETEAIFSPFGIGQRMQATARWVWDTSDLAPGDYTLTFTILPDGPSWDQPFTLRPYEALSPALQDSTLTHTETDCCLLYYFTNSAAERDITTIEETTDLAADEITALMDLTLEEPISIILMPRVLGHGGFASSELYITYMDRDYTDLDISMVFKHEIVHRLDSQIATQFRPIMLVEGLAVYLSGGHFKPEALMPRTAALLDLGWYIPLSTLSEDFYDHQHEIGYLEAASMIEFMVDTWGFEAFDDFYYDLPSPQNSTNAEVIDAGLQKHFGISFEELETQFITALKNIPPDPNMTADIQLTVNYFDTLRAYQNTLDSSAYFLNAWLIVLSDFQENDIAADILRHPSEPANITIEVMLISAMEALIDGRYDEGQEIIDVINLVLEQINGLQPNPFGIHPLAEDYHSLVSIALQNGYQVAKISLEKDQAVLLVNTEYGAELFTVELFQQELGNWGFK